MFTISRPISSVSTRVNLLLLKLTRLACGASCRLAASDQPRRRPRARHGATGLDAKESVPLIALTKRYEIELSLWPHILLLPRKHTPLLKRTDGFSVPVTESDTNSIDLYAYPPMMTRVLGTIESFTLGRKSKLLRRLLSERNVRPFVKIF